MAENPVVIHDTEQITDRVAYLYNSDWRSGQPFVATSDYTITKIAITVKERGNAGGTSGTMYVSIQGVDGSHKPDGNVLASASTAISLSYGEQKTYQLTFSSPLVVTFNQRYCFVVYGTPNHLLDLRGYEYSPGLDEGMFDSYDGGDTWSSQSTSERFGYSLYGQLVPPVVTTDDAYEDSETLYWTVTLVQKILGGNKILGVCYSTENETPTIADSKDSDTDNFDNGEELSDEILSVTPGETYYVRAFCYFQNYDPETYPDSVGYGDVLEVEVSGEITVTTNAASEISYDCAMGNGTIESGTNATERGFEVKLDFSGTLLNYINHHIAGFEGDVEFSSGNWEGELTKTETDEGDFEEGDYELVLGYPSVLGNPSAVFSDKLFKCEDYEYRAYAVIDDETYYGEYVEFSTLCDEGGDQQPDDDISDGNPTEPVIPIEEPPELPPFIWEPEEPDPYPPWDWTPPPWENPDYPPQSFVGDFYYRKPYTQKDLDDLRKKCIIYNKNSIEFALVLRHNMNVLREFFNMMTDYLEADEFNDFTDLVPPQRLKELYLDPLEPNDFRDMINGFIRNTIDNNIAVNRNFGLIQEGLSDYETDEDASFREITSNIKTLEQDNPEVDRMKRLVDSLNFEVAANFNDIMYNLHVIRARLL